jgi:hypothetical protein
VGSLYRRPGKSVQQPTVSSQYVEPSSQEQVRPVGPSSHGPSGRSVQVADVCPQAQGYTSQALKSAASLVSSCPATDRKALAQDSNTPTYTDASHEIALIRVAIRTDAGAAVRITVIVSESNAFSCRFPIIVAGIQVADIPKKTCSICC